MLPTLENVVQQANSSVYTHLLKVVLVVFSVKDGLWIPFFCKSFVSGVVCVQVPCKPAKELYELRTAQPFGGKVLIFILSIVLRLKQNNLDVVVLISSHLEDFSRLNKVFKKRVVVDYREPL